MATKKLTLKGITFPNFGKDDSKKNFRLIFHIGYKDKDGDAVATVTKPAEGHWQWKKAGDAFLQPKVVGDSVELNTLALKNGDGKKIPKGSNKIVDLDGDITDISVQFLDVGNKTFGSFILKNVVPELIDMYKKSGFDPIDKAPIPGVIKTKIKDKVDVDKLIESTQAFFAKKMGDKVLHSLGEDYNGGSPFVLKEDNVQWGKAGQTGTYGVTIDIA